MTPNAPLSTGLLLLGCAALGGIIALELSSELSLAPGVTAAAPAAPDIPEVEIEPFVPPPPDSFTEIGERPLFVPTRRPFVPPPEAEAEAIPVEEPPPEPLLAELVGVVLAGQQRAALVQEQGAAGPRRLAIGQTVDGWRVEEVEAGRALFRRGDEVQVLELRRD